MGPSKPLLSPVLTWQTSSLSSIQLKLHNSQILFSVVHLAAVTLRFLPHFFYKPIPTIPSFFQFAQKN